MAIVDDDDSVRRALARLLRAEGLRVATFATADAYLVATARGGAPACLVLDVHLGGASGMSGLELHDHLAGRGAAVPVVLITADDIPAAELARRVGAGRCLRKPVEGAALLALVDPGR